MIHRAARIGFLGSIAAVGGVVAACGGPSPTGPGVSATSNPALVTLDLRDGSGNHVGTCSGTLISPSSVLTSGHCLVAAQGAVVTKADGQTAYGASVWHTWADFESPYSHPEHSDVGVILLDREMFVSSYPAIARSLAADGAMLSRVRRADATSIDPTNFEQVTAPVHFGTGVGFPLAYTTDAANFEGATDTGGPLLDPDSNTIYGVVSSRGTSTGTIYVSRVEYLVDWVQTIAQCSPPPAQAQCHPKPPCDGGGSSSSGGSNSSGSGGGSNSSGSGGESSSGSGCGSGGWSSSGGGSGGSGSGSGGWSSGGGGGDDGGTCNPPPPPPPPPPPGDMDSGCSSSGSGSGTASSGGSGGDNGSSSSSGSQRSGSSSGYRMPEPGGFGPPLVPDGPGCIDATCGGCGNDPLCQDGLQDYGNCGCTPPPDAGTNGTSQ